MTCMLDFDPAGLDGDDSWRRVLEAYRAGESHQQAQNPESDGWVPRIRSVEGLEREQLSRAHGLLIALGYLRFELTGRSEGIRYQVSTLGKRTLDRGGRLGDDSDGDAGELSGAA